MKKTSRAIIATGSIIAFFALAHTAVAEDWTRVTFTLDKKSQEQVYAATSDSSAIAFTCIKGKLRAAIITKSKEAENILFNYADTSMRLNRKVELSIDNKEVSIKNWQLLPRHQMFVTPDKSTTAKLYNAVIAETTASIQRKGKTRYYLSFPAPNKAFAEFGSACGVGKNALKQS